MIVKVASHRIHLALSEREIKSLAEALALASSECAGRAAAHRTVAKYTGLGRLCRVPDSGHGLAAEMDEADAREYDALLRRLDAALKNGGQTA